MPNFTGLWTPSQQLQARSLNIWPATPGAPTSVTATAGDVSASVAFTAPADTGFPAGAITSFTATSSPGGFTASGASSPLTVVGLTNGTAYTFTVTATNASGTGPASSASNSVTPIDASVFVENLFSTYLYTGTGAALTITNGIDLSGQGGLVWEKSRTAAQFHGLMDTVRGVASCLVSSSSGAQNTVAATAISAFNSTGYTKNTNGDFNTSTYNYVSWTFRKKAKFFDIVTYTGNGVDDRQIAHSLGSTPGCVMIKRTDTTGNWAVSHIYDFGNVLFLNTTAGAISNPASNGYFGYPANPLQPTYFTLGTNADTNASGGTYVAYLFAHNAGGFGLSDTDNVISCGSYTGNGSTTGPTVTLGYEPQWLMIKNASGVSEWVILDNMRGIVTDGVDPRLFPNTAGAENTGDNQCKVTATGFQPESISNIVNASGNTYIYVAIRKGPMQTPTEGTSVFSPLAANSPTDTAITTGFSVDLQIQAYRTATHNTRVVDRLRGVNTTTTETYSPFINTDETIAESTAVPSLTRKWGNTGFVVSTGNNSIPMIWWNFRRAPGFFDIVCWTGDNGANQRVSHNLGVTPELIIYKGRNKVNYWRAYYGNINKYIALNLDSAETSGSNLWGSSAPTTTDFGINCSSMDLDNFKAVAYLFATLAGVSKVGSYTGTATTKQIECGFTSGARFVLIKRTDSTGAWYVWDTARGIISGNDPYLLLNSVAVEEGSTDYIDAYSAGFELSSTAPAAINASGGTYIFLAIA